MCDSYQQSISPRRVLTYRGSILQNIRKLSFDQTDAWMFVLTPRDLVEIFVKDDPHLRSREIRSAASNTRKRGPNPRKYGQSHLHIKGEREGQKQAEETRESARWRFPSDMQENWNSLHKKLPRRIVTGCCGHRYASLEEHIEIQTSMGATVISSEIPRCVR